MASRKVNFNWSILDRESIAQTLWVHRLEICNQTMLITKFYSTLSKIVRTYFPVKISKGKDPEVDFGYCYVGGAYYSDLDKAKQRCIEVVFLFNPFENKITMSSKRYHRMCYLIADTILHEIIHMRQYRRRKFKEIPAYESKAELRKKRDEQTYLGNTDEIDAYSFNIACELMTKFDCDQQAVIKYLNQNQKGFRRRYNGWRMYLKTFDYDNSHPIIRRLQKKIIRYLPKAIVGKPYFNNDWINR
jgi:hypothetical protein